MATYFTSDTHCGHSVWMLCDCAFQASRTLSASRDVAVAQLSDVKKIAKPGTPLHTRFCLELANYEFDGLDFAIEEGKSGKDLKPYMEALRLYLGFQKVEE